MQSPYPLISMEEAWKRIAAHTQKLPSVEMGILNATGLVLAEPAISAENMPPFRASSMDGYAVSTAGSGPRCLIGAQTAGSIEDLRVEADTAVHIMTGAPVPEGADAVIPVEYVNVVDGIVTLLKPVHTGDSIRPIGQDIASGDCALEAGTLLGAPEIGLLGTIGQTTVRVYQRPRVAIMATGDELVSPDETPGPGQIRDSNSWALLAAIRALGAEPVYLGRVADRPESLRKAILEGVHNADLVVSSGGVSMGSRDYVKPVLAELGTVHFGRIAVKPGKPVTFATVAERLVFGLPGFPVSSLVALENLVRPALRVMSGHTKLWRPERQVRLTHAIQHAPDRLEYQRAVVSERDGDYWATNTGVQVSGRLKSLVGANALLKLPSGQTDFAAGDAVTAIMIALPEDH